MNASRTYSLRAVQKAGFKTMTFLTLGTLAFSYVVLADIIRTNSFQAASNGVSISVHWITDDESNVAHFEIERRAGTDGPFTSIASYDTKGPSLYEFVDNTAFRKVNSIYQYRLVVYLKNGGAPVIDGPITVTHTVSGVRRTWGSIKAMFR